MREKKWKNYGFLWNKYKVWRASTDELLNSEIIQRKIKSLGSNLINIKDTNSKKVTIKNTENPTTSVLRPNVEDFLFPFDP